MLINVNQRNVILNVIDIVLLSKEEKLV